MPGPPGEAMVQRRRSLSAGAWARWQVRRGLLAMALLLGIAAGGPPARAQTLEVSGACAQQCGAASRLVRANRPEVQSCLIRCNAIQEYDRSTGAPRVQHGSPAPRTRSRQAVQAETRRVAALQARAVPAPYQAPMLPPPAAAASRGAAHPAAAAAPAVAVPPASLAVAVPPAVRATQLAAAAGGAVAVPAGRRWGAAYLAPSPATEFGLTVGLADRVAAHAQAQSACGARGAACRPALEFADRCGAVAQARRTLGLFRTADPRTYSVSYAAAGAGPTQEAAETAALGECRARERTTSCEIVASACGRP
ncbi:DUF4189 domain-containing protein [Dankookia sp. GCM10030260]|uniref:DUF4189 domain-containing protein n=1 Tax=Dankookia sp. GCM10030260 TaxID=3273390 RepID=UPI00360C03F7